MPEIYAALVELMLARGHRDVAGTGILDVPIDEAWRAQLNTDRETRDNIPPLGWAIEFNGWPAGIIDMGGGFVAAGDVANEAALLEAVKVATGRARGT